MLRNQVMAIMCAVELMLGFFPRANVYVPTIFCNLIFFIFACGHQFLSLVLLAASIS